MSYISVFNTLALFPWLLCFALMAGILALSVKAYMRGRVLVREAGERQVNLSNLRAKLTATADAEAEDMMVEELARRVNREHAERVQAAKRAAERVRGAGVLASMVERERLGRRLDSKGYVFTPQGTRLGYGPRRVN